MPGSLAHRCRHAFLAGDRRRGASYFEEGRVAPLAAVLGEGIETHVEGSGGAPYIVTVSWEEAAAHGVLHVSCDCPRFEDAFCKHLWATLLAADRDSWDAEVPGSGPLEVAEDPLFRVAGDGFELEEDDDFDDEDFEDDEPPDVVTRRPLARAPRARTPRARAPRAPTPTPPPAASWRRQLTAVAQETRERDPAAPRDTLPEGSIVLYVIAIDELFSHGVVIRLFHRPAASRGPSPPGDAGRRPRPLDLLRTDVERAGLPPEERRALALLRHARPERTHEVFHPHLGHRCFLPPAWYADLLPVLAGTGRLGWVRKATDAPSEARPLAWDDGEPWRFRLDGAATEDSRRGGSATGVAEAVLRGELVRGEGEARQRRPLSEPLALTAGGLAFFEDRVAPFEVGPWFPWVRLLRREGELRVPLEDRAAFLEALAAAGPLPQMRLPAALTATTEEVAPVPELRVLTPQGRPWGRPRGLAARLSFRYGDVRTTGDDPRTALVERDPLRLIPRDLAAEAEAVADLEALGFRKAAGYDSEADFRVAPKRFAEAAADLLERGWELEAEGRLLRRAGTPRFSVGSAGAGGVDWFELQAEVDFDGATAALPELLAAVRRKERFVRLGDGSSGLLPAAWLERYAPLAALAGERAKGEEGDTVRFQAAQVAFLDALLADEAVAATDARFESLRRRLDGRAELSPLPEPRGFRGKLRHYQREGLAWLVFLAEQGLGGCLADDMGLGKTVQLLAFLQRRRLGRGGAPGPALIVAPRSVVFNWRAEAARFTPRIRVLEHLGKERPRQPEAVAAYDLVVTTYGTLRRDVRWLTEVAWSAVALDEAQAIKNPSTKSAKAARLLAAPVRLALTGTPVENHLGDLFSIFEFLNPGMLGRAKAVQRLLRPGRAGERELEAVRRGLSPLILRRTKEQVLRDLPEKTETTLLCELQGAERRRYDELVRHYRQALLGRVEEVGLERSRIQVLEALLRLRQAACHPGLLDPASRGAPSAKLATLLDHLEEASERGHKTLVFSQFTSFLAIVRAALEQRGTVFEYLDGHTRRREERVRRFQEDDGCPVFLISLKAGGQGLNLTAADYAFLLDPWWNPAVEAQAIDRTHRIGQTRAVFAYRLIARDTVEEKVVALQQEKRRLAEAIVTADRSLFRELTLEDLRGLLA